MLEKFIAWYDNLFPAHKRETFHLIESNGLHVNALFLFFITNYPTAFICQRKIDNHNYIFIAI
jgi:hypothetical protein